MTISWIEKVPLLSIYPESATPEDVARLASELMECRHELQRLQSVVCAEDAESIQRVLLGNDPNTAPYGFVHEADCKNG